MDPRVFFMLLLLILILISHLCAGILASRIQCVL